MPLGTLRFSDGFEAATFLQEGCALPLLAAFVLSGAAHHFLKFFLPAEVWVDPVRSK